MARSAACESFTLGTFLNEVYFVRSSIRCIATNTMRGISAKRPIMLEANRRLSFGWATLDVDGPTSLVVLYTRSQEQGKPRPVRPLYQRKPANDDCREALTRRRPRVPRWNWSLAGGE